MICSWFVIKELNRTRLVLDKVFAPDGPEPREGTSMSRNSVSQISFRPNLEALEDRIPLASLSVNPSLMLRLVQPVQTADASIHQLQAKLGADLSTMKTDACDRQTRSSSSRRLPAECAGLLQATVARP